MRALGQPRWRELPEGQLEFYGFLGGVD